MAPEMNRTSVQACLADAWLWCLQLICQIPIVLFAESLKLLLQVKDLIMVVKQWRNSVDWTGWKWRPTSYLLSLLVIRAYENACLVSEGTLPSHKSVLIKFVKLVQSTQHTK